MSSKSSLTFKNPVDLQNMSDDEFHNIEKDYYRHYPDEQRMIEIERKRRNRLAEERHRELDTKCKLDSIKISKWAFGLAILSLLLSTLLQPVVAWIWKKILNP